MESISNPTKQLKRDYTWNLVSPEIKNKIQSQGMDLLKLRDGLGLVAIVGIFILLIGLVIGNWNLNEKLI